MKLISLFLIFVAFAGPVFAKGGGICSRNQVPQGGDLGAWPWGFETSFPWERIQGIWAPIANEHVCGSYFVFRVGNRNDEGNRFIRITEYDPTTCKKISVGIGVESKKVIYAQMADGRSFFNLTIRAFDPSVLTSKLMCYDEASEAQANEVIVLTMYPKNHWEEGTSYEMSKIQSSTSMVCEDPAQ